MSAQDGEHKKSRKKRPDLITGPTINTRLRAWCVKTIRQFATEFVSGTNLLVTVALSLNLRHPRCSSLVLCVPHTYIKGVNPSPTLRIRCFPTLRSSVPAGLLHLGCSWRRTVEIRPPVGVLPTARRRPGEIDTRPRKCPAVRAARGPCTPQVTGAYTVRPLLWPELDIEWGVGRQLLTG